MKAWDSDLEEEEGEEGGEKETSNGTAGTEGENGKGGREDTQGHLQKVQKLIYAAKVHDCFRLMEQYVKKWKCKNGTQYVCVCV